MTPLKIRDGNRASVSSSRTPRFRHSSMEGWNPGRHGCLRTYPANLIIMKAMQTVTAVLGRTDRGGDTLWKTLHWMFTSITPGHESRTEKGNSCMGVGWPIVVGTSRTSLSDGLPARP